MKIITKDRNAPWASAGKTNNINGCVVVKAAHCYRFRCASLTTNNINFNERRKMLTAKEKKKQQKAIKAEIELELNELHNMTAKQQNLACMHMIENVKRYRDTLYGSLTI